MADNGAGSVNVWFDNPGNFLEIFWRRGNSVGDYLENTKFDPTLFVTPEGEVIGFHIIGALSDGRDCVEETYVINAVQAHPITVRYDRGQDWWRVEWGPGVVECVATANPRIRARVDAAGLIQGVEIWDLRGFEGEILNQDLYPAELGVKAG